VDAIVKGKAFISEISLIPFHSQLVWGCFNKYFPFVPVKRCVLFVCYT